MGKVIIIREWLAIKHHGKFMTKEEIAALPAVQAFPEFVDKARVRPLMRLLRLRITISHGRLNTPFVDLPPKWQEAMLAEGKGLPKEYLDIPGEDLMKILDAHNII